MLSKILVIDDKHDNLVVVKALLKNMLPDVAVYTARSGPAGLKLARDEQPDTILLDIKMPGMDGYEVCSELKGDESTQNIPVIMLTAIMTDSKSRIKGLELGADAFLNKPINAEELVAQVKVMLRIKRAEDTLRQERDSLEVKVKERTKILQEKETFIQAVLDNLPIGVAVNAVDPVVTFSYLNDNFTKFYRTTREQLADPDVFWEVVYEDASFREEMKKRVLDDCASGGLDRMIWEDVPIVREGEETTFITARNIPLPENKLMISTVWDVTERKQDEQVRRELELQLHQSQKLEAVGTMVGGISHEFNNVLQSIFLYGGLVECALPDDGSLKGNFQHIMEDAIRARDLVAQILTFSRKTKVDMKAHPIGALLTDALMMERASMPPNIEIHNEIDLNCGMVVCDKTQMYQIMVNLCNNAQHAMAQNGGLLTVSLDQKTIPPGKGSQARDVVELVVSDTGHGMDHETLEKVFDPFFTTKEIGKGTGLGLSVVHGIVEMMDGQVSVSSEVGKGTIFTIVLPLAVDNEDSVEQISEPKSEMKKGRVLLVDDENSIRLATASILHSQGFQVETAMNGKQGLELFKASPGKFDLVITDLSMPQMSGIELSQGIRKLNTKVPIILSTGQLEIDKDFNMDGITSRIQKPWSAEELIDHIRKTQE